MAASPGSDDAAALAVRFDRGMSKPILVGHDPAGADRGPVAFGVAAARFTGAPLIIASAHADHAAIGRAHHSADAGLAHEASEPLERLRGELGDDVVADW